MLNTVDCLTSIKLLTHPPFIPPSLKVRGIDLKKKTFRRGGAPAECLFLRNFPSTACGGGVRGGGGNKKKDAVDHS